ncbi:hypothetical protein FKM82_026430 [Ascaphus truei]
MADYSIRRYKNSDYDAVRLMFAQGMLEQRSATCFYLLKMPRVNLFLLVAFTTFLVVSKSYLLSLICLASLLVVGWHLINSEVHQYVKRCHGEDLLDIEKSYMLNGSSCFWVAETERKLVGMVGVQAAQNSEGEIVLRRMSVAKDQRTHGIGKALCRTVIDFARKGGCKVVSLETSMVQYAAQKLYERVGFKEIKVRIHPTLFGKLTNFSILYYTFDIK